MTNVTIVTYFINYIIHPCFSMPSIKDILSFVREQVLKDKAKKKNQKESQKEIADKLGLKRITYQSYESERSQGPIEFYEAFKSVLGIDLFTSAKLEPIVVVDPTRYSPNQLLLFKERGAYISHIPVFDTKILPFPSEEKYPEPVFLVPRDMCPEGEFGIKIVDNIMEPGFMEGDYVFCGDLLTVSDIRPGQLYLLSFDNETGPTLQIGKAEKKRNGISFIQTNTPSNPVTFPDGSVKGLYRVVGHYRGEAGINQL